MRKLQAADDAPFFQILVKLINYMINGKCHIRLLFNCLDNLERHCQDFVDGNIIRLKKINSITSVEYCTSSMNHEGLSISGRSKEEENLLVDSLAIVVERRLRDFVLTFCDYLIRFGFPIVYSNKNA